MARRHALTGILNGVDYDEWSPERDTYIVQRDIPSMICSGKGACKTDMQKRMGLPVDAKIPVIGIVSRLADQKGFDLLAEIAPQLLRKRVQLVVLGSGDAKYQELFRQLAQKWHKRLAVHIGFDNALAHTIEAGSDMFVMPSRYEPCGLNQIYSLRYGTIPIVRATGGLQDTITTFDPATGSGTGFKFTDYTAGGAAGMYRVRIGHIPQAAAVERAGADRDAEPISPGPGRRQPTPSCTAASSRCGRWCEDSLPHVVTDCAEPSRHQIAPRHIHGGEEQAAVFAVVRRYPCSRVTTP